MGAKLGKNFFNINVIKSLKRRSFGLRNMGRLYAQNHAGLWLSKFSLYQVVGMMKNEDISERILQAMTISIPWPKFEELRIHMREFIDRMEKELTTDEPLDQVIRIQCCAFKITK